jgi:hypothetical protein
VPSDLFGTMVFNAIILSLAADITLLADGWVEGCFSSS